MIGNLKLCKWEGTARGKRDTGREKVERQGPGAGKFLGGPGAEKQGQGEEAWGGLKRGSESDHTGHIDVEGLCCYSTGNMKLFQVSKGRMALFDLHFLIIWPCLEFGLQRHKRKIKRQDRRQTSKLGREGGTWARKVALEKETAADICHVFCVEDRQFFGSKIG